MPQDLRLHPPSSAIPPLHSILALDQREADEFREFGLDMGSVKHQKDVEQQSSRRAHILADEELA
jgi:hypothetical protein